MTYTWPVPYDRWRDPTARHPPPSDTQAPPQGVVDDPWAHGAGPLLLLLTNDSTPNPLFDVNPPPATPDGAPSATLSVDGRLRETAALCTTAEEGAIYRALTAPAGAAASGDDLPRYCEIARRSAKPSVAGGATPDTAPPVCVRLIREYYPGRSERGSRLWRVFVHHKGDFLTAHFARFSLVTLWVRAEHGPCQDGGGGSPRLGGDPGADARSLSVALDPCASCVDLEDAGWSAISQGPTDPQSSGASDALDVPLPCTPLLLVQVRT